MQDISRKLNAEVEHHSGIEQQSTMESYTNEIMNKNETIQETSQVKHSQFVINDGSQLIENGERQNNGSNTSIYQPNQPMKNNNAYQSNLKNDRIYEQNHLINYQNGQHQQQHNYQNRNYQSNQTQNSKNFIHDPKPFSCI